MGLNLWFLRSEKGSLRMREKTIDVNRTRRDTMRKTFDVVSVHVVALGHGSENILRFDERLEGVASSKQSLQR